MDSPPPPFLPPPFLPPPPDFDVLSIEIAGRRPRKALRRLAGWLDSRVPDDVFNGTARAWTPDDLMARFDADAAGRLDDDDDANVAANDRQPASTTTAESWPAWSKTTANQPLSGSFSNTIGKQKDVRSFVVGHHAHRLLRLVLSVPTDSADTTIAVARGVLYGLIRLTVAFSLHVDAGDDDLTARLAALWIDLFGGADWPFYEACESKYGNGNGVLQRLYDTSSTDNDQDNENRLTDGQVVDVQTEIVRITKVGPSTSKIKRIQTSKLSTKQLTILQNLTIPNETIRPAGRIVGAAAVQTARRFGSYGRTDDDDDGPTILGRTIDLYDNGYWRRAVIVGQSADRIQVHKEPAPASTWPSRPRSDEWLPINSNRIKPIGGWRTALKPGDNVDHLDTEDAWYPAVVIPTPPFDPSTVPTNDPSLLRKHERRHNARNSRFIWLTYPGFSERFNTAVVRGDRRLARAGTFAGIYGTPLDAVRRSASIEDEARFVRVLARSGLVGLKSSSSSSASASSNDPASTATPPAWSILRLAEDNDGNGIQKDVDRRANVVQQHNFRLSLQYAAERGGFKAMMRVIVRISKPSTAAPMMFTWIHILSALTDRVANDGGMRLMAFVGDRMLKSAAMLNDKDVRILATAMASVTSAVDRFEGRRRRSINGRRDMEDCETAGWNARKQSYYILLRLTARRAGATSFPPELESIIFGYWYQDWFVEDVWTCNACTFINPSTSVPKCAVCDTPMTGPVSLTAAAAAAASTSVGIDGLTFSSRSAPFPRPVTAVRQAETLDRLMQEHARRSEMEMMLRLERQALQRKLEQDVVRNGIQQFMRYVTAVRPAAASASAAAAASSAASSSSATAAAAVSAAAPPITQPPQPPNPPQLPNPADNNDANNGCLTQ